MWCRLALLCAVGAAQSVSTRFGSSGGVLTISVGSNTSFLLSVRFDGWGAAPLSSPSLASHRPLAPSEPVTYGTMTGLRTDFGALLASADGSWVLYDAANNTLVSSSAPPTRAANGAGEAGVLLPVTGLGVEDGGLQTDNCLNNGDFGGPFFHNVVGGYLAFPVSSWLYDPTRPHCYPASFQGPPIAPWTPACGSFTPDKRAANGTRTNSYPGGLNVASEKECCNLCFRTDEACVAAEYAPAPQDLTLEANCFLYRDYAGAVDAPGWGLAEAGPPPGAPTPGWWVLGGGAADFYLAPVSAPLLYLKALYGLTGAPGIPPRYAFGAMFTYWGYDNMEQVEGNMTRFRDGSFPIDAHIMDYVRLACPRPPRVTPFFTAAFDPFPSPLCLSCSNPPPPSSQDWWDQKEIYSDKGRDYDFTYDPVMFGPHSFIHPPSSTIPNANTTGPVDLLAHFHDALHIKFAGIRKPRTYSNLALSNASGWLLPASFEVGAGPGNWNMTPGNGWAPWWVQNTAHFLEEGMDFWCEWVGGVWGGGAALVSLAVS